MVAEEIGTVEAGKGHEFGLVSISSIFEIRHVLVNRTSLWCCVNFASNLQAENALVFTWCRLDCTCSKVGNKPADA